MIMLTDALTKLLLPGTSIRDIKAWVVSRNKLLYIDMFKVMAQTRYAPSSRKQSMSRPADMCNKSLSIPDPKKNHHAA